MKGYCLNCKKLVVMVNIKKITLKNKNKVYKGNCENCATEIYKRRK